jgi:hypothetical protein
MNSHFVEFYTAKTFNIKKESLTVKKDTREIINICLFCIYLLRIIINLLI